MRHLRRVIDRIGLLQIDSVNVRRGPPPRARRDVGLLLGDRLVARVDLKADRQAGVLRVQGVYAEPGVDRGEGGCELAAELLLMADWMGLDRVWVAARGDLNDPLRTALRPDRPAPGQRI